MKPLILILYLILSFPAPARAAVKAPAVTKAAVEPELPGSADEEEEDDEEDEDEEDAAPAGRTVAATEEEDDEEDEVTVGAPGSASTLTAVATAPSAATLTGWLDVRPSWSDSEQRFHSENEVALEYRFREDRAIGYVQEFRSNLLKGGNESDIVGFEFLLGNGYFLGDVSNLLVSRGQAVTLSWEPRVYLPTPAAERDAGMVLATRQYLKLNWDLSPGLALFFWDAPIGYVYTAGGYEGEDGPVANPAFENRIELGAQLSFFQDKISLRLPVVLQSVRHRQFNAEAVNNNAWAHSVWINPEVMVQVAEKTSVGLAYYSDNLADEQLANADLRAGLSKGVVQLIFQQSI